MSLRASLIIPSYRRCPDLARCLSACVAQNLPFDEIIVVARRDDEETRNLTRQVAADAAKESVLIRLEIVTAPGVIAAMQAGLDAATSEAEIICLTDDDAAPRADWLQLIVSAFESDPKLAGVGGRDWQPNIVRQTETVGTIQWFGRIIGNHHLGAGDPREVDLLKGVNCAFRADALRRIGFDHRLRGSGAQVHWEMAICLALKRQGWRLVYDPRIAVDHFPAKRADADVNHRGGFHGPSLSDAVHNETLILLEHLSPLQRLAYGMWSMLVGTREYPGFIQLARLLATRQNNAIARWHATVNGRTMAWLAHHKSRPLSERPGAEVTTG
jgi:GT2 family glycosyltransferase